ncbi:MAG: hypothetical protein Kow0059_13260 [Candidatus Sumerlaeia bacterium]
MQQTNGAARIGVYICHCGTNIAGVLDVKALAEYAAGLPRVAVARDYKYMCSDPGQDLIRNDIEALGLNRIVVAACSPLLHEKTFRGAAARAGLNPFFVQVVNIREHGAWVHEDGLAATEKARDLLRAAVSRVALHRPLEIKRVPIRPETLVIGGGIAGIHAALTIANAGHHVYLVEKQPTIGGHMAKFDKTFPTLDCAACILTPKMTAVKAHPNITLWTNSEVTGVAGSVGNYTVKVNRRARFVDENKCTGCGQCVERCPVLFRPYRVTGNGDGHGLPEEPALEPDVKAIVDSALEKHRFERSPLISVLQIVNHDLGWLPPDVLRYVSRRTRTPLGRVYHVATFYKAFSLQPRGRHVIRVCMGSACHVRGAPRVLEALKGHLGIEPGQTTPDRQFTLTTVNCLGTCAMAPVVVMDDKYNAAITPAKTERLLKALR